MPTVGPNMHPRMLERVRVNLPERKARLVSELETFRAIAIAKIEEAIQSLKALGDAPGCGGVAILIPCYETVLASFQGIDPEDPPNPEEIRRFGTELEILGIVLDTIVAHLVKVPSTETMGGQVSPSTELDIKGQ